MSKRERARYDTHTRPALEQRHCSHTRHTQRERPNGNFHMYILYMSNWRQASKNYTKEITNWNDEEGPRRTHTRTYMQAIDTDTIHRCKTSDKDISVL